jgi:hypothetical protein
MCRINVPHHFHPCVWRQVFNNEDKMHNVPSLWITFGILTLAFGPAHIDGEKAADELLTASGQYTTYRTDDSTRFMYGTFTITSQSGQTQISAHRLRVGIDKTNAVNSFRNDFLSGKAFTDRVDIHTNALILNDLLHVSAEQIGYSKDSLTIQLRGHAVVQGDDVRISSHNINVFLSEWEHLSR